MFRSIKTKMLLLVVTIMAMTALLLALITKDDLETGIVETEEKSIRNVIHLVKLNIENQYGNLLFHKTSTIERRKSEMKNLSSLVISGLDRFNALDAGGATRGANTGDPALAWLDRLKSADASIFVYDSKGIIIAHPDPNFYGRDMRSVRGAMGGRIYDHIEQNTNLMGSTFSVFTWGDESGGRKQLGYFTLYPRRNWVIATVVDIEDVELSARKMRDEIKEDIRTSFKKIKIAKTGFLFLFNGRGEIIVHPSLPKDGLLEVRNPLTGGLLVDELKAAADSRGKALEYLWEDRSGGDGVKRLESYVDYYKTLDWYLASCAETDEIRGPARQAVIQWLLILFVVFTLSAGITYFLVRRISQPLNKLTEYAKELPTHDFTAERDAASEIEGLPARYRDEVGRLAESFIFMEESLRQYIRELRDTTAAKERIESELRIASDIQMSLIPKIFPPFPDRSEFDLFATIKPAREVGGDFYDFFLIDEDHLFFAIADVSGKGVPASLFMAVTKTLLKGSVEKGMSPSDILARTNVKLSRDNEACLFVTVFCGILDIRTGRIAYSNAGHNPPLAMCSSKKETDFIRMPKGLALGILEEAAYETEELTLGPGDTLYTYTDGVTEAMNSDRQLFSDERLREELRKIGKCSPEEIGRRLGEALDEFAGGAPRSDDITMLIIEYHGG